MIPKKKLKLVSHKRVEYLKPYIEGKQVLHVGCINHDWKESLKEEWIHNYIIKNSKEVVGIDILDDDIKELRKMGYDIRYGNAENFDLNKKFDIVFAGELIEHLENLKCFLESCRRHLDSESMLIISTPNCFGIRYIIYNLLGLNFVHVEHKHWFDLYTIRQLLEYNDFEVVRIDYSLLDSSKLIKPLNIILQFIEQKFPKMSPVLFIVAKKNK